MTEQVEAEPRPAKKGLLRICLIGVVVAVALALVVFLYMYVKMRMVQEEPEVYEGSVADVLKEVAEAQDEYFQKHEKYGTLQQLADGKMLKQKKLATGRLAGYVYEMKVDEEGLEWGLTCWPEKPDADTKSYFVDSTKEIRVVEYTGAASAKANADSPPLWEEGGWDSDE